MDTFPSGYSLQPRLCEWRFTTIHGGIPALALSKSYTCKALTSRFRRTVWRGAEAVMRVEFPRRHMLELYAACLIGAGTNIRTGDGGGPSLSRRELF
jgi:hypothetical protein